MKLIKFIVNKAENGMRLDRFMLLAWERDLREEEKNVPGETKISLEISRAQISRYIRNGNVSLNDKKIVKSAHTVNSGERYELSCPQARSLDLSPVDLKLDIIFEDNEIAIINKPSGLTVHPHGESENKFFPAHSLKEREATLVEGLLFALKDLSAINGVTRPGIVHRLDKETEGLMVVAKSNRSHIELSRQFAERVVKKRYRAIVWGRLPGNGDILEAAIFRDPKNRLRMKVIAPQSGNDGEFLNRISNSQGSVRKIKTGYRVISTDRFKDELISLVEIDLYTGRTHQIRAHLNFLGHSILGDTLYGKKADKKINNMFLQSFYLGFFHPGSSKWIDFQVDMPDHFQRLMFSKKKGPINGPVAT